MLGVRKFICRLSKSQKITYLALVIIFAILVSVGIPTLARYKNRVSIVTASVWDGSIASNYKSGTGTEINPYIVSSGSELAYFYTQLSSHDYVDTYFVLSNDIVLNQGIFNYDSTDGIQYILNDQTYYLEEYSNKYYDNVDRLGTEIGTVHTFNSLAGFKGHFNGNSYRIYGLYISNENDEELALFTDLKGDIFDLYVENSLIYGGIITGGIASTTENATLSNVLFNGYVLGKNNLSVNNIDTVADAPVINIQTIETTDYINSTNDFPFIGSEIISTSITGNYIIDGATESETLIKINGVTVTGGSFDINLGTNIQDSIPVVTSTTNVGTVTLTLSDLTYNISYKYGISAGIVAKSSNTLINNTINKSHVYGYSASGGLVGVATNSININQSYNTGDINSEYVSGGLVSVIEKSEDNIIISKSYNTGDMTSLNIGGLIGIINNNSGSISINNVFNTSTTNYSIGTINNTTVNVTDSYYVNGTTAIYSGLTNGNFTSISLNDLKTKSYVVNNLLFSEFVSFDDLEINNQNVWVYEDDSLPILFHDDLNNPIANIHVGMYSWNNLSYELNQINFDSNITFGIVANDQLRPLKEVYYYISNSNEELTSQEVSEISSWNSYSDIVQISKEGSYVIYVKVVDYNDIISYMNTDLLVLSLYFPIENIYTNQVTEYDLGDEIYYIENDLVVGRDSTSYVDVDPYITDNSITTIDISYFNSSASLLSSHTHNLISNILLPLNTKITLIDNITERVYEYKIPTSADIYNYDDSCDPLDLECVKIANYPFTLFKEVGATSKPYIESTYYDNGTVSENFTIVLDLSATNISTNYNDVSLHLDLRNSSGVVVRTTLPSTIKEFNIYYDVNSENTDASLNLATDYSGNPIQYNSESITNINITSTIDYKYSSSFRITDTTYENKEISLYIKLVDSIGTIVDKEYFKNVIFKVDNNTYYPSEDNIVRINLNSGIDDVTKVLTITTSEKDGNLVEGSYFFKISSYASYGGYRDAQLSTTELSIPVDVSDNNSNIQYSFNVEMDDSHRIINKTSPGVQILFDILQSGPLSNPNIKVSLYKKTELTAYNQGYSIVDLADYVSDTLNPYSSNIYYVSTNPGETTEFELNLITANFENNGYMFEFDLYDDTEKIGTIKKYFIVR